jgi:hypothetical protein
MGNKIVSNIISKSLQSNFSGKISLGTAKLIPKSEIIFVKVIAASSDTLI